MSQTHSLMWGSLLHASACLFSDILGASQWQSATPEQVPACFRCFGGQSWQSATGEQMPACFQVFWGPVLALCYTRAGACLRWGQVFFEQSVASECFWTCRRDSHSEDTVFSMLYTNQDAYDLPFSNQSWQPQSFLNDWSWITQWHIGPGSHSDILVLDRTVKHSQHLCLHHNDQTLPQQSI